MFFENGEAAITFQVKRVFTDKERQTFLERFVPHKSDELESLVVTESTVNLLYNPTKIMERHDTIEPAGIPFEVLKEVVGDVTE